MTDEEFWAIIAASRVSLLKADDGKNAERQEAELKRLLTALPAAQVAGFADRFQYFKAKAYHWDLWAAAYLIGGGCSDDAFMDFRNGLIASGRERYEAVLADADSLAEIVSPDDESLFAETLGYVASEVYEAKTGRELPPFTIPSPENPAGERWYDEDEEDSQEKLSGRFPRLYALLGVEE